MRKIIIVFMIVVLMVACSPVVTLAAHHKAAAATSGDEMTQEEICAQAQEDTKSEVGMRFLWAGLGCLCGVFGILGGYLIPMPVPSEKIMGKSSAYVETYTKCYQDATKNVDGLMAITGCSTAVSIYLILWAAGI